MLKVRKGGGEEVPLAPGKEQWLHFAGAAVKRYKLLETKKKKKIDSIITKLKLCCKMSK